MPEDRGGTFAGGGVRFLTGGLLGAGGGTLTTDAGVGAVGGGGAPIFERIGRILADAAETVGGNDPSNIDYPRAIPAAQLRWRERVANYSPWNDVFQMDTQETQLVVDVPFENRYLFVPWVIGYSWVEGGRVHRINPIRHPYWTWMRAARISHIGVRYTGSKVYMSSGAKAKGAVADAGGILAGAISAVTGMAGQWNDTATFGSARYKLARFTINFTNYPWDFKEDSDISTAADEWKRNTYWQETPTSQMLAAEGGAATLKFCYTDAGGPTVGQTFRANLGTVVPQIRYTLNWMWVPYDYLFVGRIPTNVFAATSKLNSSTAFGSFPKGTLLFEPPVIEKFVYPVRTARYVSYMCNVRLPMIYMDPPRGVGSGDGAAVRGHNLMPWRVNNLWYPATRPAADGSVSTDTDTKGLFAYTDQTQMFVKAS